MTRVAICAPSAPFSREDAAAVCALAAAHYPGITLSFHEQCFASEGHFAGPDALRLGAFLDCANDPACDAVWFARGGYGAVRIAADVVAGLGSGHRAGQGAIARAKAYLGYSDAGTMLAALAAARIGQPVHAPMPADIRRVGGEAAVLRTLGWLAGEQGGLEPSLDETPAAAFNLMTLAMLAGTPLMPDLSGHVVMIEEVSEYLYAVDRLLFHVTAHLGPMGIAGLRLGRISDVPENDRPFGAEPEEMVRHWCARSGIRYLGRADIGHDTMNKIVPFGLATRRAGA
ncbi:LD-carboxypeptidase [Novosphingobium sp. Chol11]|uniref:LD-carboxypeptidase n=1 Tax=Novosphingobium sp. Chol11 TaxID=1385763 RepID=UPI0025D5F0A1|nr:LD-carboxypeptidase [Novosphingobium sp. Chol11]